MRVSYFSFSIDRCLDTWLLTSFLSPFSFLFFLSLALPLISGLLLIFRTVFFSWFIFWPFNLGHIYTFCVYVCLCRRVFMRGPMYVYVCLYISIQIFICIHIYVCLWIRVCERVWLCICRCEWVYVCVRLYVWAPMPVYLDVNCMSICRYVLLFKFIRCAFGVSYVFFHVFNFSSFAFLYLTCVIFFVLWRV